MLGILLAAVLAASSPALFAGHCGGGHDDGGNSGGGNGSGGDGESADVASTGGGSDSDGGGIAFGESGNPGFYANCYDKGQKIFMEKVACITCAFDNAEFDSESIQSIRKELERGGSIGNSLSCNQRYCVKHYANKRFAE